MKYFCTNLFQLIKRALVDVDAHALSLKFVAGDKRILMTGFGPVRNIAPNDPESDLN